jgi:hypothetical protein
VRLSELLGRDVVDEDGRRLGIVHDVRLVGDARADGAPLDDLRIDLLVVGRAGVAARLGYGPNGVRGPWMLRVLARRLERRIDGIPWEQVTWSNGRGPLTVRTGEPSQRSGSR